MLHNLRTLTGARGIVCAAHRSREGVMHGHTWEVVAWWRGVPDAAEKQAELTKYLSVFDHGVLNSENAWAEALGKSICLGLDCERVEVSRPLEGLFAIVEKTNETD